MSAVSFALRRLSLSPPGLLRLCCVERRVLLKVFSS
jgi:hypothetical protein